MEVWSTERVLKFLRKELVDLAEFNKNNEQEIEDSLQENLDFFRHMVSQVSDANSGPLLPKTPKVTRKNQVQRIETIHEDETVEFEAVRTTSIAPEPKEEINDEDDNTSNRRSRRTASKKAASSIKRQQSSTLRGKMRRPSEAEEGDDDEKTKAESSDSEEEKQNRTRQSRPRIKNNTFVMETENRKELEEKVRVSTGKRKQDETRSPSSPLTEKPRSSRTRSGGEPAVKKAKVIEESMETSSLDDTLESSIYEDAIGRPAPIHNSTKIIDTTVILEPKSRGSSKTSGSKSRESNNTLKVPNNGKMNVTVVLETATKQKKHLAVNDVEKMDDEDVVDCTPEVKNLAKTASQLGYPVKLRTAKNTHKSNALFSPYATDSVKKRVEAFEQAGLNSPKAVEVDAPTRVTRTKTRAMAAAEASNNAAAPTPQPLQSIAQKLARKSLAKAKKISLAKLIKDTDDSKENENSCYTSMKPHRVLATNEKLMQRMQLKITPISKSRLQQPMSVNRLQHTPMSVQPLSSHARAMSASRTNIIMSVDSFLQPTKQARKLSSAERIEEKKRKANEEDARRKREEALKAQSDEKRRKREEKVLKNKLAREAQEKLEREKRLKAEKEREEKAKIALQMQEKQREEAEKKRLLQLQRAQEKEERRKQEEQLRLQRLQEQEETERQLAEQKRKEQENAEKQHQRRHAEAKAQQQALAEAAKYKAQLQAKPVKHLLNNTHTLPKQMQVPNTYQLESEPDDDDDQSDNEDAPKHPVPSWATAHVRKQQLALQTYIPSFEVHRYFDSRQCTPDLTKIFEAIDKRRLKRTSSAIWKTPPRYSMMYNE